MFQDHSDAKSATTLMALVVTLLLTGCLPDDSSDDESNSNPGNIPTNGGAPSTPSHGEAINLIEEEDTRVTVMDFRVQDGAGENSLPDSENIDIHPSNREDEPNSPSFELSWEVDHVNNALILAERFIALHFEGEEEPVSLFNFPLTSNQYDSDMRCWFENDHKLLCESESMVPGVMVDEETDLEPYLDELPKEATLTSRLCSFHVDSDQIINNPDDIDEDDDLAELKCNKIEHGTVTLR